MNLRHISFILRFNRERACRALLSVVLTGMLALSCFPASLTATGNTPPPDATTGATVGEEPSEETGAPVSEPVSRYQIVSESAVLMDADSGQILFEKNMHEQLAPASITKIMTALLAIEKGDFSDTITMSHEAVFSVPRGASHIALDVGEQLPLEQAMYAMMLPSANDAANGIAEAIGGTLPHFAELMNQRAKELGAQDTQFVNANGLSEEGHHTSAYDMALITREAMKHAKFQTVWGTERYEMAPTNLQPEPRIFFTQNKMLSNTQYHDDDIIGGKLGYTREASNTMVVAARRNGRTLICVLLKTEHPADKYADAKLLLDDGFDNYRPVTLTNLQPEGSMTFLLHNSLRPEQIAQTYRSIVHDPNGATQVQIDFSLVGADRQVMYPELGSITLTSEPQPSQGSRWMSVLKKILLWLLVLIGILFLFLVLLAAYLRARRRRRRIRKKRLRRQENTLSERQP
jgi:D-alanyl-D-alanine carboxypeptidase